MASTNNSNNGHNNPKLCQAVVMEVPIEYRRVASSSTVLFKTDSIVKLTKKAVPSLLTGLADFKAGAKVFKASKGNPHGLSNPNGSFKLREFVSWKSLKGLINEGLTDQALRDTLNSYEPFVNSNDSPKKASEQLQKDHIKVGGVEVAFLVSRSRVFFDILGAFTMLGELNLAMRNRWQQVDILLQNAGLGTKDAFRRCHKSPDAKAKAYYSHRSHISLSGLAALVANGFVKRNRQREATLLKLFKHLESEVEAVIKRTKNLCEQLEALVEDVSDSKKVDIKAAISLKRKCCDKEHQCELDGKKVQFVLFNDKIFFEKLDAFSVLGRLHVVRSSDYRKADRVLGKAAKENYLFEEFSGSGNSKRRNRRTHVSAEAFIKLIDEGFADPARLDNLKKAKEILQEKIPELLKACEDEKSNQRPAKKATSDENQMDKTDDRPSVEILGLQVPYQVSNDVLFLEKKAVFGLYGKRLEATKTLFRVVDKAIEEASLCLDDAFLYEGRSRTFVSNKALIVLVEKDIIGKDTNKVDLLERLKDIEANVDSFKTTWTMKLGSEFNDVAFKIKEKIYVHTVQVLMAVGFSQKYLENCRSKVFFVLGRLLTLRGLNSDNCFLRQGKSKYCFISLSALLVLFETDFGPFKSKERTSALKNAIFEALKARGFVNEVDDLTKVKTKPEPNSEVIELDGAEFRPIRFRTKNNELFVNRRMCFEAIELEKAIMSCPRGYAPINEVLQRAGVDLHRCYLSGKRERFAFISLAALFTLLLESQDPLLICLKKKDKFAEALMSAFQRGVCRHHQADSEEESAFDLDIGNDQRIATRLRNDRVFLDRHTAYTLAGLYDKPFEAHGDYDIFEQPWKPLRDRQMDVRSRFFGDDSDDPHKFISIDALLVLMNLDGDISRAADFQKVLTKSLIEAVALEAPKLKIHVQMSDFRRRLLSVFLKRFMEYLESKSGLKRPHTTDESDNGEQPPVKIEKISIEAEKVTEEEERFLREALEGTEELPMETEESTEESPTIDLDEPQKEADDEEVVEDEGEKITLKEFKSLVKDIRSNLSADGLIGDWRAERCDLSSGLKLVISASKKMSFIHNDVSAVMRYEFEVKKRSPPSLFINDLAVPYEKVNAVMAKEKGSLTLMFALATLRPCFGCFDPELVETAKKGLLDKEAFLDSAFVGSSRSGRNFAGSIRSKYCKVLSESRVVDSCSECEALRKRLVVDRSVLEQDVKEPVSVMKASDANRKSVWKLQESSSSGGCVFVCPQIQSFDTSLPSSFGGFSGQKQATTIVEHGVKISAELEAELYLNGKRLSKGDKSKAKGLLTDFTKDKQVGPLLEKAATLRLCTGYPDRNLVDQTRYIAEHKKALQPEIRKFFEHIVVDEDFRGKMGSKELVGTVRAPTCRVAAAEQADICGQCRLLKEPIEFLGLK